jgi:hypothetical protein
MPAGLAKGFHGSLIASFPGTNVSWLLLGDSTDTSGTARHLGLRT